MTKASDILDGLYYYDPDELGEDAFKPLGDDEKLQLYTELKSVMPEPVAVTKYYGIKSAQQQSKNNTLTEVDKALAQFFGVELTEGEADAA